ncbi:F0F1 ATP synthase subunit B [Agrococcus sp. TF02-05]|uniref:F0F1 ATP synthase subunit B n=1 Tax=Agrococcus sp. TF02-05 TaxID=2815211 RepID=UPI001AA19A0A|nr:F0F1 ATP synthase subunit B [Agrococcus sp. TF02-05]MBO1771023.1 F0F1 ATP synthase subunit B [Agrococcus sp. TF02-05]
MLTTPLFLAEEAGETAQNPLLPAPYDIIWSAVIFVVLLLVFWKVVLPRVQALLDERAAAIEGGIKKAEEAQAEAAAALESYNTQLAEARAEAARIKDQARADAARIEADLKARANEEAERITAQAHQRIEAERQAAFSSLKTEVGSLALDLSEKVVGESMDDARSAAIVERFLADLEREGANR